MDVEKQAKAAARAERAAAKAEKAAKAAISNPDGTPLLGNWGILRTESAAQLALIDIVSREQRLGRPLLRDAQMRILAALAHKRGQTIAQVSTDIEKRLKERDRRWRREEIKRGSASAD